MLKELLLTMDLDPYKLTVIRCINQNKSRELWQLRGKVTKAASQTCTYAKQGSGAWKSNISFELCFK